MSVAAPGPVRDDALALANRVRIEAAAYKRRCACGEVQMIDAILECEQHMTLGALLKSFPRWGVTKAERLCQKAGIPTLDIHMGTGNHGNRQITQPERRRLVDALNGKRTARVTSQIVCRTDEADLLRRLAMIGCTPAQVAQFFGISKREATNRLWAVRQSA